MEQPFTHSALATLIARTIRAFFLGLSVLCSGVQAAQFTLTWADNSTNETGFRIERSTNGSTFTEISTVGANVVSYVDAGLPNSTTYWYRLRAYNSAGNSGYSNVATGTTPPPLSNNAPTISDIANQNIYSGGSTGAIPFTIGDVETAAGSLSVTVSSSNTTLAPLSRIALGGSGTARTISVTPSAGRTGSSTITVAVSDGSLTTTDTFVLTVSAVGAGPVISVQPQATSISPGSAMTLSVTVVATGTVTYQWYYNGGAIAGATAATYTIPIAQRTNAGTYHVVVTAGGISVSSATAAVTAGTATSVGRLVNLSSRASVLTGDNLLIPGFVVTGNTNKRVLLRVVGPSLAKFGLTGLLNDPKLVLKRLVSGSYVDVATSLDWADGGAATTLRQAFVDVGAFSLVDGSGDAALVSDLPPGTYSVFATDEVADRTGLSMVEVYDAADTGSGSELGNISTRGFLGSGSSVMITGFVIADGPMTLVLRTIGPGLTARGVTGAVADPSMELHGSLGGVDTILASNDDWSSSPDAAYTEQIRQQVGAFSLGSGSKDAACVVTLPAGSYTLISRGSGSTTGLGLVEVYVVR
ncbi:MAG: fibronectin type III domain-containing protein [Opitutaceae bacterium]|nr:fibronectin type III domain-containing protein [Opitutaceae bacterium]